MGTSSQRARDWRGQGYGPTASLCVIPAPHLNCTPSCWDVPWAQHTFGLLGPQLVPRGKGVAEPMTTASKQHPTTFKPDPGCSRAFPCPHWGDHRVGETPITPHHPHHRSHARCPHAPRAVHAVSCQGSHPRHMLCLICLFMYLFIYFPMTFPTEVLYSLHLFLSFNCISLFYYCKKKNSLSLYLMLQ